MLSNRTWKTWWEKQEKLPLWMLTDPTKMKGELLVCESNLSNYPCLQRLVLIHVSALKQSGRVCISQWHEECHLQAWWDRTEWTEAENLWGQQKVSCFGFFFWHLPKPLPSITDKWFQHITRCKTTICFYKFLNAKHLFVRFKGANSFFKNFILTFDRARFAVFPVSSLKAKLNCLLALVSYLANHD